MEMLPAGAGKISMPGKTQSKGSRTARPGRRSEPAGADGDPYGVYAVTATSLGDCPGEVIPHGANRETKVPGDLRRRGPLRSKPKSVEFPCGQRVLHGVERGESKFGVDYLLTPGHSPDGLSHEFRCNVPPDEP